MGTHISCCLQEHDLHAMNADLRQKVSVLFNSVSSVAQLLSMSVAPRAYVDCYTFLFTSCGFNYNDVQALSMQRNSENLRYIQLSFLSFLKLSWCVHLAYRCQRYGRSSSPGWSFWEPWACRHCCFKRTWWELPGAHCVPDSSKPSRSADITNLFTSRVYFWL